VGPENSSRGDCRRYKPAVGNTCPQASFTLHIAYPPPATSGQEYRGKPPAAILLRLPFRISLQRSYTFLKKNWAKIGMAGIIKIFV
jgi:hypothetical protein